MQWIDALTISSAFAGLREHLRPRSFLRSIKNKPQFSITFIDVSHLFVRDGKLDRDLFYDPRLSPPEPPLHPTAQGMALIAKAIEPTLASLMGDHVHQ